MSLRPSALAPNGATDESSRSLMRVLVFWVARFLLFLPAVSNGQGEPGVCVLQPKGEPTAVVLMAGQSNMVGLADRREISEPAVVALTSAATRVLLNSTPLPHAHWVPLGFGFGLNDQTLLNRAFPGARSDELFGPELGLGITLAAPKGGHDDYRIAIIKHARPETDLAYDWNPDSGREYHYFLSRAVNAINALGKTSAVSVHGVVWMQGESDAFGGHEGNESGIQAATYRGNLATFIDRLRHDLYRRKCTEDLELPVVIGRISPSPLWIYSNMVREAQLAVSRGTRRVAIVDTDHLGLLDGAHYDAVATLQLGALFATALHALPVQSGQRILFDQDYYLLLEGDQYCLLDRRLHDKPLLYSGLIPWNLEFVGECTVAP